MVLITPLRIPAEFKTVVRQPIAPVAVVKDTGENPGSRAVLLFLRRLLLLLLGGRFEDLWISRIRRLELFAKRLLVLGLCAGGNPGRAQSQHNAGTNPAAKFPSKAIR